MITYRSQLFIFDYRLNTTFHLPLWQIKSAISIINKLSFYPSQRCTGPVLAIIVDIKRNFSTTIFHIKRRYVDDVISFTLLNQIHVGCQITSLWMHLQQVEGTCNSRYIEIGVITEHFLFHFLQFNSTIFLLWLQIHSF